MFNNHQHQLMCEIEGIENAAQNAVVLCQDEEWEHIAECLNVIFKRFHAAFRVAQKLGLVEQDPIERNAPSQEVTLTENSAIQVSEVK